MKEAGAKLWAISPQSVAANAALVERRELPFPVLADSDQAVIRAWGLFNAADPKGRAIPYPAVYLLDGKGVVRWRQVSLTTRDRPTVGELLTAVRRLGEQVEE